MLRSLAGEHLLMFLNVTIARRGAPQANQREWSCCYHQWGGKGQVKKGERLFFFAMTNIACNSCSENVLSLFKLSMRADMDRFCNISLLSTRWETRRNDFQFGCGCVEIMQWFSLCSSEAVLGWLATAAIRLFQCHWVACQVSHWPSFWLTVLVTLIYFSLSERY